LLHIKLGDRCPASPDDLMGRDWWGYDPNVPDDELFQRNCGRWKLNRSRANREDYVLYSYKGTIKYVAEIHGADELGDRVVLTGRVLKADDPVYQRWVGAPAPDGNRNPVHYYYDPSSSRTCRCGCGEPVPPDRAFVPGHDQRAVHERITEQWGDTVGFINWYDLTFRNSPHSASQPS
jgi:hypothetical protein